MISDLLSGPCFLRGLFVTELPSELWSDLTERQHWFTNYFIQQKQTQVRERKRASNYFQSRQTSLKYKWAGFYFKGNLS